MKILVFNGSPKGECSNTLQMTKAFCEGIAQAVQAQLEIVSVYQREIQDCRGCFRCWSATPGICCLQDDMAGIISKILEADLIIWSFPLYYFSLPSRCKALMDRLLPMNLPFMSQAEAGGHPSRYDLSQKRYAVISTCGFYTPQGNYDAVNAQFDRLYGKNGYTALYCGEGELFRVPELQKRTQEYLDIVRQAGKEFAAGAITPQTREHLSQLLFPREVFEEMADADWGAQAAQNGGGTNAAPPDVALKFTRQMAALYNKAAWGGKDRVVEFHYTDVDKTYQILLQKEGHRVLTEDLLPYTTRIETPLSLWRKIAAEEVNGRQAMMDHQYTVQGDFELMLHWDEVFGVGGATTRPSTATKKTNMSLMLAPWIVLWVLLPFSTLWGGIAGILAAAALPLALVKWKATAFEGLTTVAVAAVSLLALLGAPPMLVLSLSYLLFGLMWLGTVFCKLPLSAYYSINSYRGEQEWENPLFVHTNRILTTCWGALYMGVAVWTYFLLLTPFAPWTGLVNSLFPALLGAFTIWFQKWYPAHYAARGAGLREEKRLR